ncbi:MAG: hypothetical protein ACSHW0_06230 [Thalassotalea sp.]
MIKLSRTGWNNVIIFSVMGFILLINLTQKSFNFNQSDQQQLLLAEHAVILSLTINQQTNIERIGKTWRALPAVIQGQPLDAMMQTWQQITAEPIAEPENLNKDDMIVVSMVLAGYEQDEYLLLLPQADQLVIYKQSEQQYYRLAKQLFTQLIPPEVIL